MFLKSSHRGLVLFLVCAAIFMLMLDATVVAAALADIRTDFGTSIDGLQWVIDGYSLPLAGLLLTFATMGDRYGRKRVFVTGMVIFTATSLALSIAGSAVQLDVMRAVQGIGAAMLFATALPILSDTFPERAARMKAIGIYSAIMGGASAAGPVIGGALVTAFGWRSIFLVNVPIGVVVAVLAIRKMPESRRPNARRSDWPGSVLLTGGLVAAVLVFTRGHALGWHSAGLFGLAATAIVALVAFVIWESRAAHPLIDLRIVRRPGFTGTAVTCVALMATLMAAANYLALFMINTLGYTALQMGVRLLPVTVGTVVAAPIAAKLLHRVRFSIALPASLALIVTGLALMAGFHDHSSWLHFVPGMIIGGIGLGAATSANQAASLTFAPAEDAGMSSATFATFRQVGMAMGVAALGAIFNRSATNSAVHGMTAISADAPQHLVHDFADGVGAGGGVRVLTELPPGLHDLKPALAHLARVSSIDGLNALVEVGTGVGIVALAVAILAFAIDAARSRRQARRTESAGDDRVVVGSGSR